MNKKLFGFFAVCLLAGATNAYAAKVSTSTVVEVELGSGEDFAGNKTTAASLATVEVAVDAEINKKVKGHVQFLYEEGDTDPYNIDEGTISIGKEDGLLVTVGKKYLPFGKFESNMISDPYTLELGETVETALLVAFTHKIFSGSVFFFNGNVEEAGATKDSMEQVGLNADLTFKNKSWTIETGASYINSINDSDGLSGVVAGPVTSHIAGLGLHVKVSADKLGFIAEYVKALDEYQAGELAFDGAGAQPNALNLELSYAVKLASKEVTFALAHQTTGEALALGYPEHRIQLAAGYELYKHTNLAVEIAQDSDYSTGVGGTGNDTTTATIQLAIEF